MNFAEDWARKSQEMGALHCRALALYGLGRYAESATALDMLADRVTSGQPMLWTSLLQQAGRAHNLAGHPDKALMQWNKAIDEASLNGLDQMAVAALTSHAELLAQQGKYFDSLQDMDHAIALSSDPALTLQRGKIYQQMGALALARKDINETLKADPDNAEAKALSATLPGASQPKAVKPRTVTAKRVAVQKKLAKKVKKPAKKKSTKKKRKK